MSDDKSWAEMLGEEKEEGIPCQSCSIPYPRSTLKPYKIGKETKILCNECILKREDEVEKKRELSQKKKDEKVTQKVVLPDFTSLIEKIDGIASKMITKEDLQKLLEKNELTSSPVEKEVSFQVKTDPVPSDREILSELFRSQLGYISHYDTFRNRWGVHHNETVKKILYNLWVDGTLSRNDRNRLILNPDVLIDKINIIMKDPISIEEFEKLKQASNEKARASSTKFLKFSDLSQKEQEKYKKKYGIAT